jgi:hypothetical protein
MSARNDRNMFNDKLAHVAWRKSRHSGTEDACVETAFLPDGDVAVRDSKDRDGPVLCYTPSEWRAFIAGVKDGEFELA